MLKKLLCALLLVSSLVACKSKEAFKYSQDFVKKEKSLEPDITQTENSVSRFIAAGQYDSIGNAGERMEKIVQVKIDEIKKEPAPDVKEGENFKSACIRYFEYIKNMYSIYKSYGRAPDEASREAEMQKLQTVVAKKATVISDMQAAQRRYAEANGFKLENK